MTAVWASTSSTAARGMIFIHSTSAALCPHVEWAVASLLGGKQPWHWTAQSAEPGSLRAEISWTGSPGTGARLATRLSEFSRIRFEVTEDAGAASEGRRYCYTPSLGRFTAVVGVHGDILVPEDRIRYAMEHASAAGLSLQQALEKLLGTPWDDELESFRYGSEDAPIRYLHHVG